MLSVKMNWKGGLKFEGTSVYGHTIVTDGTKKAGGEEAGYAPTELMFFGIAGCTGIDVVRIMEQKRQLLSGLAVEVKAHHQDEYPKPFHTVEIKFIAKGNNIDEKALAKAIELSESKYCSVSQTVEKETKVTTSFEIISE
ncbi:MAG: osmotically inducible protein OsmC [Candidatus Zixiibacteriota bacterium]|nr:MAG: osmotically inducible protein OsmC [candidate division Zixibacteria bacterium]